MKVQDLTKCAVEARTDRVRQKMIFDKAANRASETPETDEQGRFMWVVEVDVISDVAQEMEMGTLVVHSMTQPVLQLTELHQELVAEDMWLEFWEGRSAGHRYHCVGLQVA